MRTMPDRWWKQPGVLAGVLCTAVLSLVPVAATAEPRCELIGHDYLGNYPNDERPGWHERAQGIASDKQSYWYFSNKKRLFRVPVDHELEAKTSDSPGSRVWSLGEMGLGNYDHIGDIDYYAGYVFIALENFGDNLPGAIAAFDPISSNMAGVIEIQPGVSDEKQRRHAPLVFVDSRGHLYVSEKKRNMGDDRARLLKLTIDTNLLLTARDENGRRVEGNRLRVIRTSTVIFRDRDDRPMREFPMLQGGDDSDDGYFFYLVNGKKNHDEDGIYVFQMSLSDGTGRSCSEGDGDCTGRLRDRSVNGSAGFGYQIEHSCCWPDEPEGALYWDLDSRNAPSIPGRTGSGNAVKGQFHAILLDLKGLPEDEIFLKHYRAKMDCPPSPPVLPVDPEDIGSANPLGD